MNIHEAVLQPTLTQLNPTMGRVLLKLFYDGTTREIK